MTETGIGQEAVVAALMDPAFYPFPVTAVECVQTHISAVFLTGGLVYKMKKPVNFGFLDFSTLEKRRFFCHKEVELNSRLAPWTYLGVATVNRDGDRLSLNGPGEPVEYLVNMRQMDQEQLGLNVLKRGGLSGDLIDRLVDQLVPFYAQAATGPGVNEYGRIEAVRFSVEENFAQTRDHVGVCLSRERRDLIRAFATDFLASRGDLFRRRVAQGRIRECHGDLHLNNICFEDPPAIFDCIEFNERFRCSDVAADLAFLAMDLDFHGLKHLGDRLIQGYVVKSGDRELLEIIDFYKCYRAFVRGKIHSFTLDEAGLNVHAKAENLDLARRYFLQAQVYTASAFRPRLVVAHGLMGTGKSTLGKFFVGRYGHPLLRTDQVRKKLAGLEGRARVEAAYGQGIYGPEFTARTYREVMNQARGFLEAGIGVVLDGSFKLRSDRALAADLAGQTGAELVFIQTVCQEGEQKARLAKRGDTPSTSDGRLELWAAQKAEHQPPDPDEPGLFLTVATDGPKEQTRTELQRSLERHGL